MNTSTSAKQRKVLTKDDRDWSEAAPRGLSSLADPSLDALTREGVSLLLTPSEAVAHVNIEQDDKA